VLFIANAYSTTPFHLVASSQSVCFPTKSRRRLLFFLALYCAVLVAMQGLPTPFSLQGTLPCLPFTSYLRRLELGNALTGYRTSSLSRLVLFAPEENAIFPGFLCSPCLTYSARRSCCFLSTTHLDNVFDTHVACDTSCSNLAMLN
jgi:hypothetical protein